MKKCKVCSEEKENQSFEKYRSTCRKCRNEKNTKSWLSKPGNLEKRKEYNRIYCLDKYHNSPEYKRYYSLLGKIRHKLKTKKIKVLLIYLNKSLMMI